MNNERLTQLSQSHGFDGGGYEYTNPEWPELSDLGAAVWEDPDFDYLMGDHPAPKYRGASLLWVFCAGPWDETFPATLPCGFDDMIQVLVATGYFNEYDRACDCHGKAHNPTGAAGDALPWEFTGNTMDGPWPECVKCDGSGYYTSEGGCWAVYAMVMTPGSDMDCEEREIDDEMLNDTCAHDSEVSLFTDTVET
jgi:hypothetical protein